MLYLQILLINFLGIYINRYWFMFRQRFSTLNQKPTQEQSYQYKLIELMQIFQKNPQVKLRLQCSNVQCKIKIHSQSNYNYNYNQLPVSKVSSSKMVLFSDLLAQNRNLQKQKENVVSGGKSPLRRRGKTMSDYAQKTQTKVKIISSKNSKLNSNKLKTFEQIKKSQNQTINIKTAPSLQLEPQAKKLQFQIRLQQLNNKNQNKGFIYSFMPQQTSIRQPDYLSVQPKPQKQPSISCSSQINDQKIAKRDSLMKQGRQSDGYQNIKNPYSDICNGSISKVKSKIVPCAQSKQISLNLSSQKSNSPIHTNLKCSKQNLISLDIDIDKIFDGRNQEHNLQEKCSNLQVNEKQVCKIVLESQNHNKSNRYLGVQSLRNPYCKQIQSQILQTTTKNTSKIQEEQEEQEFDFDRYSFELSLDHIVN